MKTTVIILLLTLLGSCAVIRIGFLAEAWMRKNRPSWLGQNGSSQTHPKPQKRVILIPKGSREWKTARPRTPPV